MRKLLALLLSLAFCAGFAACSTPDGGLSVGGESNSGSLLPSTSDSSSEQETTFFDIRYVAVINGTVSTQAIPQDCFQANKNYPTRYEFGEGITIDNLQSSGQYEFCGWYVDEACMNAFSGTISATNVGEVKLYAKLVTSGGNGGGSGEAETTFYDIRYVAVINGTVSTQAIPQDCFQTNKNYPTRYEFGEGITIDNLQSSGQYEFCGWYVDEACMNAFSGTISATNVGEVKLYAKINTQGTITYRAIISGEEKEIVDGLWKDGGAYPTTYQYGQSVTISELKSECVVKTAPHHSEEHYFKGWYADAECTKAFNGVISENQRGNVVIYAKITCVHNLGPF